MTPTPFYIYIFNRIVVKTNILINYFSKNEGPDHAAAAGVLDNLDKNKARAQRTNRKSGWRGISRPLFYTATKNKNQLNQGSRKEPSLFLRLSGKSKKNGRR